MGLINLNIQDPTKQYRTTQEGRQGMSYIFIF